jgi:hypothetical protein
MRMAIPMIPPPIPPTTAPVLTPPDAVALEVALALMVEPWGRLVKSMERKELVWPLTAVGVRGVRGVVEVGRVEVVESVGEEDELVVIKVSWAALVSEVACGVKEEVEEVFGAGSCWVVVSGGGVEGGVLRAVVGALAGADESVGSVIPPPDGELGAPCPRPFPRPFPWPGLGSALALIMRWAAERLLLYSIVYNLVAGDWI